MIRKSRDSGNAIWQMACHKDDMKGMSAILMSSDDWPSFLSHGRRSLRRRDHRHSPTAAFWPTGGGPPGDLRIIHKKGFRRRCAVRLWLRLELDGKLKKVVPVSGIFPSVSEETHSPGQEVSVG